MFENIDNLKLLDIMYSVIVAVNMLFVVIYMLRTAKTQRLLPAFLFSHKIPGKGIL